MALHTRENTDRHRNKVSIRPQFSQDEGDISIPKYEILENGISPSTAHQIIHDELLLDGNAKLNLATFVTTWMEPEAESLMAECSAKNMIDKDEYPQTAELEKRCVNILARLWHAEEKGEATGCSTTGSSEACMLGGLALKWLWRARQSALGKPTDRPNLVMGSNVQVVWEKFCRYFDVEPRLVPVGPNETHLTPEGAIESCDENTIGVVAILGSTYDGVYEPVKEISAALDRLEHDTGLDIPIHVDAASGGFVAPFLDAKLEWDFRLPRVKSINASGHKYGLVYPGIGWIIWRDSACLPEELIFKVNYLGGEMPTFALNFSRPGAQVAAQYYNFLRLGRSGYRAVQQQSRDTADWLAKEIGGLGPFTVLPNKGGIPAFAFKFASPERAMDVYGVSESMRTKGWQLPAYAMPPDLEDTHVLRIVVRNGFGRDLAEIFLAHLTGVVNKGSLPRPSGEEKEVFHH